LTFVIFYFVSSRATKYCNQRVCMSVCVSVCSLACLKKTHKSKLHEIVCTCYLWLWLGPPLTTVQCVVCGFVDEIMYSHNGAHGPESKTTRVKCIAPGGGTGGEVCRLQLHLVCSILANKMKLVCRPLVAGVCTEWTAYICAVSQRCFVCCRLWDDVKWRRSLRSCLRLSHQARCTSSASLRSWRRSSVVIYGHFSSFAGQRYVWRGRHVAGMSHTIVYAEISVFLQHFEHRICLQHKYPV